MLTTGQLEQIRLYAEEVASREGCMLYDLEFRDGPGRTLRVFIDKEPGGVSIDDCVNVSRGLNLRLDVEDVIPGGRYELEVSSPGMDRRLTQPWHFQKAVGQTVQLKYKDESGTGKPYEGKLLSVEGAVWDLKIPKGRSWWIYLTLKGRVS
ncbi:MAG: ribosome maturation factor RimP [Calothrix sp. SM1_5_4]|nr:ribosome maturation factor RimP [Calothrix sp. SM1_5_4]